jgi:hypothetical protein
VAETGAASGQDVDQPRLEPRWPVALAVSAFIVLTVGLRVLVPRRESLGPHWVVPAVEIALLVVLVAAHPATPRERARLRRLSIALTALLAASALVSTVILIYELVTGSEVTSSADSLLASGTLVWVGNALVFGLLYWQLDSGGPLAPPPVGSAAPRLRLHPAAQSRAGAAGVAPSLRRLLRARLHHQHRLQPDRRDAHGRVGQAG